MLSEGRLHRAGDFGPGPQDFSKSRIKTKNSRPSEGQEQRLT